MKKLKKLFIPIATIVATTGAIAPLAVSCGDQAPKYNVTVTHDDGFDNPTVEMAEIGKDIQIKCNLKDYYDFDNDTTIEPEAEHSFDPNTNILTIQHGEGWDKGTNVFVNLKSTHQEYSVDVSAGEDEGFVNPQVISKYVGDKITIQCTLKKETFSFAPPTITPQPKDSGYSDDNDLLTIVPDDNWNKDTNVTVTLHSTRLQYTVSFNGTDSGFNKPLATSYYVGEPLVIKCNLKNDYNFANVEVTPAPEGTPEYNSESDTLTIQPGSSWSKKTTVNVALHSTKAEYNVSHLAGENCDPTLETHEMGQPITIKYNMKQGYGFQKATISNDPTYKYNEKTDILTITPSSYWTKETEITIIILTQKVYDVTVDATALKHITGDPIVTKVFGSDIKIECDMTNYYILDPENTTVTINEIEEPYEDIEFDETGKILTIHKSAEWSTSTKIDVVLAEKEVTYDVTVDASALKYITGEPVVTKTFGSNIKIECNMPSYYVLNEVGIVVMADSKPYKDFKIDDSGHILTITKSDSWDLTTKINVTLAGLDKFYNVDVSQGEATHVLGIFTVKRFGQPIVITCPMSGGYRLDPDRISVTVDGFIYMEFDVIVSEMNMLYIGNQDWWTTSTKIVVVLGEKAA